ncbi:MAG: copper amine oxidase N-terminal domain-containing protein [Hydrogenibacillus schlegelii]|nr:copper amine oxidase N-terminal domain-containing protein [Hydrogenibacillus schlegelii]
MRSILRLLVVALALIFAFAHPGVALKPVQAASPASQDTSAASPSSNETHTPPPSSQEPTPSQKPSAPAPTDQAGHDSSGKQNNDEDVDEDEDEDEDEGEEQKAELKKEHKKEQKHLKKSERAVEKYRKGLEKALEKVKGTPAEPIIQRLNDATLEELQNLLALLKGESGANPAANEQNPAGQPEDERTNLENALKALDDDTLDAVLTQTALVKLAERSVKEQTKVLKEIVEVYEKLGKRKAALAAQEELLRRDPKDREAYEKLGRLLKTSDAAQSIRVYVNGELLAFDVAPRVENGRTLAPIRAIAEALGLTVTWNEQTREVTLANGEKTITLQVGNPTARVDGQAVALDAPPTVERGRTLVPLRFVSEALGASVDWVPEGRLVAVTRP